MYLGLRDLFMAPMNITADADGEEIESYGSPLRVSRAIKADLSTETAEEILCSDDSASDIFREFVKSAIKLTVRDLAPEILAKLLGLTIGDDKVTYYRKSDTPPYVAIGFRAKTSGGRYKYLWLLKVQFKLPNEAYETQGNSIKIITPEIEGTAIARNDGLWKADFVALPTDPIAVKWFKSVRLPENVSPPTPPADDGETL